MQRYLLNVSYVGTYFRGAQRQVTSSEGRPNDPTTVQGQIEIALKKLRPLNIPAVVLSSRTDAGVHCLHTTMHVDLEHHKSAYRPTDITTHVNKYFWTHCIPIRILKTYIVPDTFHCRHNAISRTYMYKIVVINTAENNSIFTKHIPIEDFFKSLYICSNNFDVEKAREAARLFEGVHDFRTFMAKSSLEPDKVTRRNIEKFEIYETKPISPFYSWPSCINRSSEPEYRHIDIVIKSSGFLYRQVRRSVASLIAVAKGIVTSRDIRFMLEIPSHRSWNPRIKTVAAHGLYLCEVAYSREDQQTFKEDLDC